MRRAVLACLLLPCLASPLRAAEGDSAGRRSERVAGLCRAWTAAKYLHPDLWQSERDWDAAFARAAAAVGGDAPTERYREIAAAMLGELGDPLTEVVAAEEPGAAERAGGPPAAADTPLLRELEGGVLLADLAGAQRARGPYAVMRELPAALRQRLPRARGLILDFRFGAPNLWSAYLAEGAATELVPRAVQGAARRWIVHWGYPPQRGGSSGGYRSGLVTSPAQVYPPAAAGGDWRIVLLVDQHSELPEVAVALRAAGLAKLVSEGAAPPPAAERVPVDLGEGLTAWVRTAEALFPATPPPGADVTLSVEEAKDPEAAVRAARRLLADPWPPPAASAPVDGALGTRRPDADYPEMLVPPLGMRLLSACRAWGVIHHFYPYLELIGDWDGAFRDALPDFAAAESEDAYARAVLALMAQVADGHTGVGGHPAILRLLGAAWPQVQVRLIEGRVAVTRADGPDGGLRVGDVVLAVDGEPLASRIDRLLPLVTGSTEVTRRVRAASHALAGPAGSTAALDVEGADGARRRVEVKRAAPSRPARGPGSPWRRLTPRIGYVDLRLLEIGQVDAMLEELRDTAALVFDLRGYPNGTAWALAPRRNRPGAKVGALFRRRELSADSFGAPDAGYFFAQPIPERAAEDWIYAGETVMLIDERAISQAEHTGLFLEAAAGTVFVGEPTAGANGDVTNFALPGGISVSFTGHDVRHADGRQLQRVGIQPDVPVAPTLAGLRAGRDEVLERALAWLEDKLGPAPAAVLRPR
ncbi:MAG TPA: S41 family peptidase [Thermoanaerobaculia bacterium]|nr:S41 family peptidase [Thermoanaerobaculia bacterium]